MGIQNKDGALYFATGIDNSGLYSGRQEAMGIIKAMAGEITAFDVFGGIGISAGIAFTQAAKEAYNFEKQFQQSMKEVHSVHCQTNIRNIHLFIINDHADTYIRHYLLYR